MLVCFLFLSFYHLFSSVYLAVCWGCRVVRVLRYCSMISRDWTLVYILYHIGMLGCLSLYESMQLSHLPRLLLLYKLHGRQLV